MANNIKRHFYKDKHYKINWEDNTVELLPDFYNQLKNKALWGKFGFKKVGGSSIGDVLQVDQWKSQFAAFCRLAWIGIPVLDRKYVDAGIAIEPKILDSLSKQTGWDIQGFDAREYNFDYFAGKDDVVGGLPDGFVASQNLVLEVKTSGIKNKEKWEKWGIPAAYLKQAQLYAYLMKSDKFAIVAGFVQEDDYKDPNAYDIEGAQKLFKTYQVNIAQAEDDIRFVKDWYNKYTSSGVSPKFDEQKDADLIKWLDISSPEEWESLKETWIEEGKLVK